MIRINVQLNEASLEKYKDLEMPKVMNMKFESDSAKAWAGNGPWFTVDMPKCQPMDFDKSIGRFEIWWEE